MQELLNRLIVVSNRLPIALQKEFNKWVVKPGAGGLVTAMSPLLKQNKGGIWIGWPGTTENEGVAEPIRSFSEKQGYLLHPVFLSEENVNGFYQGFSNEVLWPLFHGFHNRCNFNAQYWQQYLIVNEIFAREIKSLSVEDDYIWVHDYHLLCVAQKMYELSIYRNCGFFLHIPFPSPDIFLKLPWRREILKGLLHYDLIGFQTRGDVDNFVNCLKCLCRDLKIQNSGSIVSISCSQFQVKAGCFPISIDCQEFEQTALSREVSRETAALNRLHPERQILLGVDRLDYTKGIPERLEALRQALLQFPDLRGRISLLQVVVPSREGVYEYRLLKEEIEQMVGEINGQFTQPGWIPVHYLYRSLPRESLISFYLAAEMALISPLKDGMNLVAKEYCICNYRQDGLLLLSEFAGAAASLSPNVILVNPYDVNGVAEAIRQGFYINKEERSYRMQMLRKYIFEHDIYWWLRSFLEAAFYSWTQVCPEADSVEHLSKIEDLP